MAGCKIVNLEAGLPNAERAMLRLSQELRIARAYRVPALKVIHGYGSTGRGGTLRSAARKLLNERLARGQIRAFVAGEDFSAFTQAGRSAVNAVPQLKSDRDFGRENDGITIVIV